METIWLEIDTSKIMTDSYIAFMSFLNIYKMKYTSYIGGKGVAIEIEGEMTPEFNKTLNQFVYYQPIIQLDYIPEVSEQDICEEMSNTE